MRLPMAPWDDLAEGMGSQWPMDTNRPHQLQLGLRRLQTCNSTQLGTCLLDRALHLELELDEGQVAVALLPVTPL